MSKRGGIDRLERVEVNSLAELRRWFKRLFLIYADGTYGGRTFVPWVFGTYRLILEVVLRKDRRNGFRVLPKRWLVERTFVRLSNCRRLSRDYEALPETSEAFIHLAMIRLMLKRLA